MFSNGRKTIGLFIFNTHGEFQREVCRAMEERAKELGYNLAIFASHGLYGTNEKYHLGEMNIFNLPDYSELAGIVITLDTINKEKQREDIIERIKTEAKCPVVSLRVKVDGFNNIIIDEDHSMEGVIRHVIEDHGKKDIAFMTGVKGRFDAEHRVECFRRLMKEYDLPVDEHRVFYGDFWRGKGKEACDWFSTDGKYPEAIICANDPMALSVIDELSERGINVPKDVIVTGYDNMEEGAVSSPSLTTVDVDFSQMAYEAVDLIDRHAEDDSTEDVYVSTYFVTRKSCGCSNMKEEDTLLRRCLNHKKLMAQENLEMQFSFMTINFGGMKELSDLPEIIHQYIFNIDGFLNYFICLRDDIEDGIGIGCDYTDMMRVRVAFDERVDLGAVDVPYERKHLLPAQFTSEEPQCFFFFPLHFLDHCFGYEVYNYYEYNESMEGYVRWNIAISNAIQNILEQKKMNDLISELENMYVQDVLTGLYNRRGFEKYARMQFSKARAKDSMVCVIGIDMDGLKPINDIYGHHEGDSALRAVGYAIQEATLPGQIGARIGGDEFEVIFPCDSEDEVKQWCKVFEASLEKYNKKSLKPYDVYASYGYKCGIPTADDTIASYMNECDDIMYKNKVANKRKRNQELR